MSGTLRLSVLIDGDTRAATQEVGKVTAAVEQMGAKAASAGKQANTALQQAGQGAATATRLSTQQLGQMQYQLQDIAVGLTSGQSPFTVIMQQGSQLAQMFQSGTGVRAALAAVGQGLTQFLLNPLNLAVLGFAAASAAAATFFSSVSRDAQAVDLALENHKALIDEIQKAYDGAKSSADEYFGTLKPMLLLSAQNRDISIRGQLYDQRATITERLTALINQQGAPDTQVEHRVTGGLDALEKITAAVNRAIPGLVSGTGSAADLSKEIANIAAEAPKSAVELRNFATALIGGVNAWDEEVKGVLAPLRELEAANKKNENVFKALGSTSVEAGKKVLGLTDSIGRLGTFGPDSPYVNKSFLDLIGTAEGTDKGRGYNETLGYGRFTGGDVDLVTMTLRQVLDLQSRMLANPANTYNSSAVGRYQITRETLLDFMPRLGLTSDTLFSRDVQDRIALAIANAAGRDVEHLRGRWEGLIKVPAANILSAFDSSSPVRSGVAESEQRVALARTNADAAAQKNFAEAIAQSAAASRLLSDQVGRTAAETAKARREQQLWDAARRAFGDRLETDEELHKRVAAAIEKEGDAAASAAAKQEQSAKALKAFEQTAREMEARQVAFYDQFRGIGSDIVEAIAQAREAGKSWMDALGAGLDQLRNKAISILDQIVDKFIDSALFGQQGTSGGGLLGSLIGNLGGLFGGGSTGSFYALGGGFQTMGEAVAFASGSAFSNRVVSEPTAFRFGAGGHKLGLMAEAGPEAVMPLVRGPAGFAVQAVMADGSETALPLKRTASGKLGVMLDPFAAGASFDGPGFAGLASGSRSGGRGLQVNVNQHNYAGVETSTQAHVNSDGGLDIEVLIGKQIDRHLARPDVSRNLARSMGVTPPARVWG